jgi:CPA1 family monovalent cation:H+ antiporter
MAFGVVISWTTHRIEDPMVEITLTTVAAYGSFVVAEQFHFSGVIATVVAGVLCGNYGARTGMSPSTRIAVVSFWEYLAFALNSIVFLLIGFEVKMADLLASWKPIVVAFLAVMVGRALVVSGVSAGLRRTRERIPWSWSAIITWGGLRGGLSMVLVLTLARDFPHRDLLVTMTFGVVILSILINGLTMAPLLRRLGIIQPVEIYNEYEREVGRLRSAKSALREIKKMARRGDIRPDVQGALKAHYVRRAEEAQTAITDLKAEAVDLRERAIHSASRHLLLVEKDSLIEAYRLGLIGKEPFEELSAEIDARLVQLEEGEQPPPPPATALEEEKAGKVERDQDDDEEEEA